MSEQTIAEEWRVVNGFPGYEVSDLGRVRTWLKRGKWKGPPKLREVPKVLKLHPINKYRHMAVILRRGGDKKKVHCTVHRLVLIAFKGSCPPGLVACHNDGNPANNIIGNLRWDTMESNYRDRDRHGRTARGERNGGGRKLTEAQVVEIKRKLAEGQLPGKIALSFPVTPGMIDHIMNGRAWRHVVIG
jgi:hypothetical protein